MWEYRFAIGGWLFAGDSVLHAVVAARMLHSNSEIARNGISFAVVMMWLSLILFEQHKKRQKS